MSVDSPDVQIVPEPALEVTAQTSTGQSRLAYRLAAALILTNVILGLVVSIATGSAAVPSVLVIDSALAIGLIDLRRGARALVLFRASIGVIVGAVFAVLLLLRAEQPLAAVVSGALLQLADAASIGLLLLGKSKPWRIALAIGIFVIGLASARLWEPFVGAAAGQTVDGTKVAIDVLLALAIAELVAATAIKQMAQASGLSRLAMILLAIASVITMVWVALLIGVAQYGEVFLVTILWPVAAFIVLAQHSKHKTPESFPQRLPPDTRTGSQTRWVPFAISFVLALLLNALAIVFVDQETYGGQHAQVYLGVCLPVSTAILAMGAWVGAKFAEGYGSSPWKGAAVGVWIGSHRIHSCVALGASQLPATVRLVTMSPQDLRVWRTSQIFRNLS